MSSQRMLPSHRAPQQVFYFKWQTPVQLHIAFNPSIHQQSSCRDGIDLMLGRILNLINIRQQLIWAFFVKTAANIVWKALDENPILGLFHLSEYIEVSTTE